MNTNTNTVRAIMTPLQDFPCLSENSTVRQAIQQLRSFCPINTATPCGFSELMVVDGQGRLAGRVSQQGVLRVLFASLLEAADVKNFEGRRAEYSDLATLLNGVLMKEGVNHLDASLDGVIERNLRVLSPEADLIHAMAVMVLTQQNALPVEDNGVLLGVVKLAEVFGALGDSLQELETPPAR